MWLLQLEHNGDFAEVSRISVKPFGILLLFVIFCNLIACSSFQRNEVKVDTYDKCPDTLAENLLQMDVVEAAYGKPQLYVSERAKSGVYLDNASCMINISILLRRPWRTSEGVMRVREIAASLGITVTTGGSISLSGKVERESFEQIFGTVPTVIPPELPTKRDFGTTGGYASEEELVVPEALSEYVETISVVPPARRF